MVSWEQAAAAKRSAPLELIPEKWRLESIPSAEEQRDATQYICQFVGPRETEIIEADAPDIASYIASGEWTALEVTETFCHRASLAHQMVFLNDMCNKTW